MGVSRFEQIEKLTNLNHGAIEELFAPEFKRVLNNLADNNTSHTARDSFAAFFQKNYQKYR